MKEREAKTVINALVAGIDPGTAQGLPVNSILHAATIGVIATCSLGATSCVTAPAISSTLADRLVTGPAALVSSLRLAERHW